MNNQQAVVEQIINNLAFEVEAVPKYKTVQTTSISKITPLNVKIRVRKKDEIPHHDAIPITDETVRAPQKIRLVSSDQTIMAFDVFMEAEFEKKRKRKLRNHIFDMLRPGLCLGPTDDDDYPYMPSSSYSAKITEPSVTSRSDGVLKQNFTLTKHNYQNYTVSTQPEGQKWLFGKCKPGGCLDPPFSEDKYSYRPSTRAGHEQIVLDSIAPEVEKLRIEDIENDVNSSEEHEKDIISNERHGKVNDEDRNSGRHSSIFVGGVFKRKRKSSDKSTNTKSPNIKTEEKDSILNIYQVESTVNSLSTHSNSIITYPPQQSPSSSDSRISTDKTVKSRGPSENKSRKSFNDHSEPYFIPPKGVNRVKEKDPLHQRSNGRRRSSDLSNSRNIPKDSSKIPVPIPIPIPFPLNSNQLKAAVTTDSPEKDPIVKITPKDTTTPEHLLRGELITEDIDTNPDDEVESLKIGQFIQQQPEEISYANNTKLKREDTITSGTNVQPLEAKESQIKQKGTPQLEETIETEPPQKSIPMPIPIPIPLNLNKFTRTTETDAVENDRPTKYLDKTFYTKSTPQNIKEEVEYLPEDVTKEIIVPGKSLEEAKSAALIPESQYSEISGNEAEYLPNNYLRTKTDLSDPDSNPTESENILTKVPIMEGDMQHESFEDRKTFESGKPTIQNDNNILNKDNENKELLNTGRNYLEEWSDGYKIADIDIDIEKNKLSPNEVQNADSQIISKFPPPSLYNESIKVINDYKLPEASKSINDDTNRENNALLSNYNDELEDTLPGANTNEIDNIRTKVSPLYTHKENISKSSEPQQIVEPNNGDNPYSFDEGTKFTNNEMFSFIAAPVIIDKTEQTSQYEQVKQVYSVTNMHSEPTVTEQGGHTDDVFNTRIASRFKKNDDDIETHSTVSHELIGNKSVIYDFEEQVPSTASVKNTVITPPSDKRVIVRADSCKGSSEIISKPPKISGDAKSSSCDLRNKLSNKNDVRSTSILSSVPSTSTLKSALKKDIIHVELGFQSYINDKNERILRTFGAANEPKRIPNDSVTVIKSQIRLSSNEIRIPVDSDHDMSIQIKKPNTNQRVSISESGFVNIIDTGRMAKQRTAVQTSDGDIRRSEEKGYDRMVERYITDNNVVDLYEQELIPLQSIIKNLRDEIDVLAAQQLIFKDKIYCPKKLPRLVHSNKKCFGCLKK